MTVEVFHSLHGVRSEVRINEDSIEVKRSQRVDQIIDGFRQQSEHMNRKADTRIGARIPIETYMAWKHEWKRQHADRWDWKTFLAQRINNPDFKFLRNQKL
jgi:hypothetical protein